MSKIQLSDAITKKSFIGFVIAIFIFFAMNVDLEWEWPLPTELKFVLYVFMMAGLVILEIPRPGISKFMMDVFEALNDGRLTPEEKLAIIQSAKDNLFGQWADLSAIVERKKENPPDQDELDELKY